MLYDFALLPPGHTNVNKPVSPAVLCVSLCYLTYILVQKFILVSFNLVHIIKQQYANACC